MNSEPASFAVKGFHVPVSRERFLRSMFKVSAGFMLPGFFSEALLATTPTLTQGPYYPLADDIRLDKDNDLVRMGDNLTLAAGVVEYITGTVYDLNNRPVKGALVELWAADHQGDYLYSAGTGRNPVCDANFAGFGQFLTGITGKFRFRTIKAGLYTGRTRHHHWGVTLPGRTTRSTTQTGWNETARDLNGNQWATQNSNDMVFSGMTAEEKAVALLNYTPLPGTVTGEMQATWDYYSAYTPVDSVYPGNTGQFTADKMEIVPGPTGTYRVKITIPAYTGYTYELYTSTTMGELDGQQIPFALTQAGAVGNHKHTATSTGSLSFYVPVKNADVRRFYSLSFRVPGANTGTP